MIDGRSFVGEWECISTLFDVKGKYKGSMFVCLTFLLFVEPFRVEQTQLWRQNSR